MGFSKISYEKSISINFKIEFFYNCLCINIHFIGICFDLFCTYLTITCKMVLNALFFLSSTPFLKNPDSIKDFHLNDVLYLQNIRSSRVSSRIYVNVDNLINKIPETFEDRFTERNINDNEAPANLTKNVCMKIKIGLRYSIILININILITII